TRVQKLGKLIIIHEPYAITRGRLPRIIVVILAGCVVSRTISPLKSMISKSTYLRGLQCQKLLWHSANAPSSLPDVDSSAQALFDQGQEIGLLARMLFTQGTEVVRCENLLERVRGTQELLLQR